MESIETILQLLAAPAMLVGAFTYLSKQFINSQFKSKQKEFELKLKQQLDTDLHSHKEALENQNLRFRVSVAGVYEKQADVLIVLYQKIADVDTKLYSAINFSTGHTPHYSEFEDAFRDLKAYYNRNKILLPDSTDVLMDALLHDAFWSANRHKASENELTHGGGLTKERIDKIFENKKEAEELSKTVPQIKKDLTEKLREIIGVSEPVL